MKNSKLKEIAKNYKFNFCNNIEEEAQLKLFDNPDLLKIYIEKHYLCEESQIKLKQYL